MFIFAIKLVDPLPIVFKFDNAMTNKKRWICPLSECLFFLQKLGGVQSDQITSSTHIH